MTFGLSGYAISGLSLALVAALGFSQCQGKRIEGLQQNVATVTAERDSALSQVASQQQQMRISEEVRQGYAAQLSKVDELARTVRRMASDVSVCASIATYPVPDAGAAPGVDAAPAGEQLGPAETILTQLAAEFAERADRTAEQLNALISWLEQTRASQ